MSQHLEDKRKPWLEDDENIIFMHILPWFITKSQTNAKRIETQGPSKMYSSPTLSVLKHENKNHGLDTCYSFYKLFMQKLWVAKSEGLSFKQFTRKIHFLIFFLLFSKPVRTATIYTSWCKHKFLCIINAKVL